MLVKKISANYVLMKNFQAKIIFAKELEKNFEQ